MVSFHCLRCESDISGNDFFYTLARNSYMFGFFCCADCAQASEHNKHLKAFVLRVSKAPETHKDLVLVPDISTLRQYDEELERHKIRKKYFS
jgi:hypothetical protein